MAEAAKSRSFAASQQPQGNAVQQAASKQQGSGTAGEDTIDQRRHPRYPVEGYAEVFLPHGGLLFRGKILNVSLSGCYIETSLLNLERGTQVEVYFVANQLQFRVAGTIAANRKKSGAGIAFLHVSPRQERLIAELVGELAEKA